MNLVITIKIQTINSISIVFLTVCRFNLIADSHILFSATELVMSASMIAPIGLKLLVFGGNFGAK